MFVRFPVRYTNVVDDVIGRQTRVVAKERAIRGRDEVTPHRDRTRVVVVVVITSVRLATNETRRTE